MVEFSLVEKLFCLFVELVHIVAYVVVNVSVLSLFYAVGIEEFSLKVYDYVARVEHSHSAVVRNFCDSRSLQVFFSGKFYEFFDVVFVEYDSHSLLRFAYRKFRTAQSLVLLGYFVEINIQTVRKLADSYAYAARAEVVALDDKLSNFLIAEKSLNFSFRGRITLLYFCSAHFYGFFGMRLGRACCAAAAVSARLAA